MTKEAPQMLQFTLGRCFKFKCNNRHQQILPSFIDSGTANRCLVLSLIAASSPKSTCRPLFLKPGILQYALVIVKSCIAFQIQQTPVSGKYSFQRYLFSLNILTCLNSQDTQDHLLIIMYGSTPFNF